MRAVLDTNVVLSALLFQSGRLTWLRESWTQDKFLPLADKPCVEELLRVLAYPKFKLEPDEIKSLLGGYLPYTETIENKGTTLSGLPVCRDLHDQKFLSLAQKGNADVLVIGDQDLLSLNNQTCFQIETPTTFKQRF